VSPMGARVTVRGRAVGAAALGVVMVALAPPSPVQAQTTVSPGASRPASKAVREAPTPQALLARASETGGWWMVARTACDVGRSAPVLERMNAVLAKLGSPRRIEDVVERVQDPYLSEPMRLKLEAEMLRVNTLQTLAGDIRAVEGDLAALAGEMKPLPDRLDRPEWKLAAPVRGPAELEALRARTDQTLAEACAASLDQIQRLFIDDKTGIRTLLR
jgi:hypothetical protein